MLWGHRNAVKCTIQNKEMTLNHKQTHLSLILDIVLFTILHEDIPKSTIWSPVATHPTFLLQMILLFFLQYLNPTLSKPVDWLSNSVCKMDSIPFPTLHGLAPMIEYLPDVIAPTWWFSCGRNWVSANLSGPDRQPSHQIHLFLANWCLVIPQVTDKIPIEVAIESEEENFPTDFMRIQYALWKNCATNGPEERACKLERLERPSPKWPKKICLIHAYHKLMQPLLSIPKLELDFFLYNPKRKNTFFHKI